MTEPSPRDLLATGITTSSPPTIHQALDLFRAHPKGLDKQIQTWALRLAVKKLQSVSLRVLLEEFGRERVELVDPVSVGAGWARPMNEERGGVEEEGRREGKMRDVLEVLVGKGWDVNCYGGQDIDGGYLICYVTDSYNLVQWCLDHRANVAYPNADTASVPPILEITAKHGTVETFKLLQEHRAPLGKRILHRAVEAATWAKTPEGLAQRMEMVRYLVEEVGLDVNGMDEEGRPNFYGTPLNYAAHAGRGKEVAEYLLQKGADPRKKDRWGVCDAWTFAKQGNPGVLVVLDEWKEKQENGT